MNLSKEKRFNTKRYQTYCSLMSRNITFNTISDTHKKVRTPGHPIKQKKTPTYFHMSVYLFRSLPYAYHHNLVQLK